MEYNMELHNLEKMNISSVFEMKKLTGTNLSQRTSQSN